MRILIADDEYLVRSTLLSMLKDLGIDSASIDEAGNGQEVVDALKKKDYHVVFIDIRMPVMDGLEAIRVANELKKNLRWVVISGHSEFKYAQQAIKLGVKDYLLKPVEPAELEKLVKEIGQEYEVMAMKRNQEVESEMNSLYSGLLEEDKLIEGFNSYQSLHLQLDIFDVDKKQIALRELYNELNERFRSYINLDKQIVPVNGTAMDLSYVVCCKQEDDVMDKIQNTIRRLIHKYSDRTTRLFFFLSDEMNDESQLMKQIRQIENLIELRFLLWDEPVIEMSHIQQLLEISGAEDLLLARELHQLYQHYYNGEMADFVSDCERLMGNGQLTEPKLLLTTDNTCHDALDSLKAVGVKALSGEVRESTDIVEVTKDYVLKNYMHNIGVNQIAEMLNITPNYLSALFKKKEDITFVRYLTAIRMEKAHQLLADPNVKVSDVAKAVGFYSARHFSKLYKQKYGIYPSESQKK